MVTNVYVNSDYNRLWIDKALANFRKPDNNKNKNMVRSAWRPFPAVGRLPLQPGAGCKLTNDEHTNKHINKRTNQPTNKQTNTTDRNTS